MSITDEQIKIVQTTFAQVGDADALAIRFYDSLFTIDPSTRVLFKGDMKDQRRKLLQTLTVVVHSLDDLTTIIPAIESLGRRHVTYGVTIAHWDTVGAALLTALSDHFGDVFTSDIRKAWGAAYGLIAHTAIEAAYPQEKTQ